MTGTIIDNETGTPLENAIVFLANTPIGTSSARDGTFRISFVRVGEYQMVISRVGYNREAMNLNVSKSESLYYEIKLKPQPVRTAGVEVYGERPAELKPSPTLFLPKERPGTYCIYGAANTMPVGIFFSDSAFYMYSLNTAVIDSEKYIRLWLLYKNLSQTPYDFDPMRFVKLHMRGAGHSFKRMSPTSSSEMLTECDKDSAMRMISETIGKFLHESSIERSNFIHGNDRFDLWATIPHPQPWLGWNAPPDTPLGGINPNSLFGIFSNALNSGILDRYKVYPGSGVHGFIYFPFPGLNWKATASGFPEAAEYVYTIEIITQSGSKYIEFEPH